MTDVLFSDGVFQLWPALAVAVAVMMIGFAAGGLPGVASLSAPVLTLAMPFEQAQAVIVPMFLFGQFIGTVAHWKYINWKELVFLVALSSIGVAVGWWIWTLVLGNPDFPVIRQRLKCATACLILALAFNLYRTRIQVPPRPSPALGRKTSMLWCVLAGTLSTIANVSGSLVVWFLNTRHLPKEQLTSTVAASYLIINALKIAPYTALGFYDLTDAGNAIQRDVVAWVLILTLMAAAILLGRWRLHRTTQRRFNIALVSAMLVVATGILWQVGTEVLGGLIPYAETNG